MTLRPLLILGTRPEAIKMAPVIFECQSRAALDPIVCFTGQHREMLRQVTDYFEIEPQVDLNVMSPGQSLAKLTSRLLVELDQVVERYKPNCLVAQGDTTSVLAAAMVSFYRGLPLVHVEAGLRTGNLLSPFPEEFNRRVAGLIAGLHAAPTQRAADALLAERTPPHLVRVTGNTVIDALLYTRERERSRQDHWRTKYSFLEGRPFILVTTHRRENHGRGLAEVFSALGELAAKHPQLAIIFPVHLNPQVQNAARELLGERSNVFLVEPAPYPEFVWLMDNCHFMVTDSGGVQEEAPSLRRPVLVVRDTTERQESVECGAVKLVGSHKGPLLAAAEELLASETAYRSMQVSENPYGDGKAAKKIVDWMLEAIPTAGTAS